MSISRVVFSCSLAFVMGAGIASAEADAATNAPDALAGPGGGGGGGRGKMVDACKDKKDGQTCKVDGQRSFEGKCTQTPRGKLACMNEEMRARVKEGRSKAKEACKGKSAGTTCNFKVGSRSIDGTCFDAPSGRLCRPANKGGGGKSRAGKGGQGRGKGGQGGGKGRR